MTARGELLVCWPAAAFVVLRHAHLQKKEGSGPLFCPNARAHNRPLSPNAYTRARNRLITVNTIRVPDGVDGAALSAFAMDTFALEIAGGLGPTVGKVWRVGLMGANASPAAVELVLAAFKEGLAAQGWQQLQQ